MSKSKTLKMTGFETTGRVEDDLTKIRSDAAFAALLDDAALYGTLSGAMFAPMLAGVEEGGAVESDGVDSVEERLFCALMLYPEVCRRVEVLYGE
jgi:hypothetical protein